MKYIYFPGCSLKGTGRAYEESLLSVFKKLQIPLPELPGWNCCGATAYMAVDEMKAFVLAARNLVLAESPGEDIHLVAPCNACYLVLMKVQKYIRDYDQVGTAITSTLQSVGLKYTGNVKVRHPLDILVNDVGMAKVGGTVSAPLKGMKVACYYGCQVVRPYALFDDQYNPQTMDTLMKAAGAEAVEWPLKARCCGGTLTGTLDEAGLRLSYILLREAKRRGANVVATACPLCQFNLECYQQKMRQTYGEEVDIPVVYFTQLLGKSMGIDAKSLGLHRVMVPLESATLQPA